MLLSQFGALTKLSDDVLPLDYAMGVCEDYARSLGADKYAQKDAAWRKDLATEKQKKVLRDKGIHFRSDITKGEAAELVSSVMGAAATQKQIVYIKANRLHDNPELLTKNEAYHIIRAHKERLGNTV